MKRNPLPADLARAFADALAGVDVRSPLPRQREAMRRAFACVAISDKNSIYSHQIEPADLSPELMPAARATVALARANNDPVLDAIHLGRLGTDARGVPLADPWA